MPLSLLPPCTQLMARQRELEELGGGPTQLHRAQLQCVLHASCEDEAKGASSTAASSDPSRRSGSRPLQVLCGSRGPATSVRLIADQVVSGVPAALGTLEAHALPLGVVERLALGFDVALFVCSGASDHTAHAEPDAAGQHDAARRQLQQQHGANKGRQGAKGGDRPFAAAAALLAQAAAHLSQGVAAEHVNTPGTALELSVSVWALMSDDSLRDALAAGVCADISSNAGGAGAQPPQARPPVTRVRLAAAAAGMAQQVTKLFALADFEAAESAAAAAGSDGRSGSGVGSGSSHGPGHVRAAFAALDVKFSPGALSQFPAGLAASLVIADLTPTTALPNPGGTRHRAAAAAPRCGAPATAAAAALAAAGAEQARCAARARDFSALAGLVSRLADQQRDETG
jgi:hypothetical protein